MKQIDYYLSPLSPYCYLAGARLEEIAAASGATINYKPIDVMGVFDETGGVRPAKRHPSRMAYRSQELARWSAHTGLPLNLQPAHWPTNGAVACYAIIAAQADSSGGGSGDVGGLVQSLLRACWAEDKDIAEESVVRAALEQNGFDGELVNKGMEESAAQFESNTEEAIKRGVFGVPFYWIGEEAFWGQDRLEFVERSLAG